MRRTYWQQRSLGYPQNPLVYAQVIGYRDRASAKPGQAKNSPPVTVQVGNWSTDVCLWIASTSSRPRLQRDEGDANTQQCEQVNVQCCVTLTSRRRGARSTGSAPRQREFMACRSISQRR